MKTDTSRLVELPQQDTGTGLHPIPIPTPIPSPHTQSRGLAHTSSVTSATSHSSSFSQFSETRPSVSPVMWEGAAAGREGVISGMSQMSESDRGHLRGISETSVSTVGGSRPSPTSLATPENQTGPAQGQESEEIAEEGGERGAEVPPAVPDPPTRSTAVSPLTPGQKLNEEGGDYLTAKEEEKEKDEKDKLSPGTPSSKRRSNFSEELGER
jgi:hypothetical protein